MVTKNREVCHRLDLSSKHQSRSTYPPISSPRILILTWSVEESSRVCIGSSNIFVARWYEIMFVLEAGLYESIAARDVSVSSDSRARISIGVG